MPIGRSAKKSLRKSIKNKKENNAFKIKLKESTKKFLGSPDKKTLSEVSSMLDKSLKKNIFKKNKVSRLKSRYAKKITKKAESKAVKTTKKM